MRDRNRSTPGRTGRRVTAAVASGAICAATAHGWAPAAGAEERLLQGNIQGHAGNHLGAPMYADTYIGWFNNQVQSNNAPLAMSVNEACIGQTNKIIGAVNAYNVGQPDYNMYRADWIVTKTNFSQADQDKQGQQCFWTDNKGVKHFEYGNALFVKSVANSATIGPVEFPANIQDPTSSEKRKWKCRQISMLQPKYYACSTHLVAQGDGPTCSQAVRLNLDTVGLGINGGPGVVVMGDLNLLPGNQNGTDNNTVHKAFPNRGEADECAGGAFNFPTHGSGKIDYILHFPLGLGAKQFSCGGDGWVMDGGTSDHDFLIGRTIYN